MKVLFINDKKHDYLSESLFHGLRELLGNNCIDYPRYDQLYIDSFEEEKHRLRGNGFTLYGLLTDNDFLEKKRKNSLEKLIEVSDVIIFNDIVKQHTIYKKIKNKRKVAILDGGDHPYLIPYENISGNYRINPLIFFESFKESLYFKRELISIDLLFKFKGIKLFNRFRVDKLVKNLREISFSIPSEKINYNTSKNKTFNSHIVDKEILALFPQKSSDYIFTDEALYYQDLSASKFGITSKRGGWDCLRHYELAANGCVLCFKNLDLKPISCAPKGLTSDLNCISYTNPNLLIDRVNRISTNEYEKLQIESYKWIEKNTTKERAKEFLSNFS
ncbi:hypothetical protein A5893_14390 [Pedobacter psychrophilus]|uniref:Glycosyltransferase n=1 Tax=Pedobacter psychrophilus TaxID=1826909 RepID=A0A179DC98_9SPHI|nr:hypothetical protein [Pedobacter psychrophilus]OAQ38598.1 hypothetical protein A5893_14390 [Pedobacter psychrophilus]